MKIDHGSRQTYMTEPLLYIQKTLAVLKQMGSRRMPQGMYGDGTVEAGFHQRILQYDSDISRLDGLRSDSSSMRLEYKVVTGKPLLEDAQQEQQLCRDSHTAVLLALALIDEYLLAVKTDVIPLEATCLAHSESTVINSGEQSLVIQVTETDKPFHLLLGEHTWESLWLAYFWQDEASRFLETHILIIILQSKHGMFEMRDRVAIPVQEHRQIVIDICLCKVIRKFLKIQYGLGYLQAVVVDTAVGILGQTKFFSEKRYAFLKIGNSFNRPVQGVIGHGVLWCRGLMAGLLRLSRHLPAPLNRRIN
jgi:hypothetical protein